MTGSFCARAADAASRLARPRVGAVVALAIAMTACSTDDVWRPSVDVGQQTSAIAGMQARPLPDQPLRRVAPPSGASAGLADQTLPGASLADEGEGGVAAEPGPDDELVGGAAAERYEEVVAPAQSIAPAQGQQISAAPSGDVYQDPTLDLDTRPVVQETPPVQQEEEPIRVAALPRTIAPLPPSEPDEGSYPRVLSPRPEPPSALSRDEADCRRQLKKLGVRYQDLAPIRDSAACFIDHPVKVSAMGNVQMKPAATLTCRMALTFAQWTKKSCNRPLVGAISPASRQSGRAPAIPAAGLPGREPSRRTRKAMRSM